MAHRPSIGKWISILYRYGHAFYDEKAKSLNITSGLLAFLMALYRLEGISQDKLSKEIRIDKATTARALSRLEQTGYIVRQPEPSDKRAYRIFLTDKARNAEGDIRRLLRDWEFRITEGFSTEEKDMAYQLLERMAQNAIRSKKSEGTTE